MERRPALGPAALLVPLSCAWPVGSSRAQEEQSGATTKAALDLWKVDLEIEESYESNVFNLSDDTRDRMREERVSDQISGRFRDMEEPDDFITSLSVALQRRFVDSAFDGLRLEAGLRGLVYSENKKKSHPEFFAGARQQTRSAGTFGLEFDYEKDVFAKNYLADAVDPVGSVSSAERRYEAGVYDDATATFSWERRLWSRGDGGAWWQLGARHVDVEATLGAGRRWYDDPFPNRDRDRLSAGLSIEAGLGKRWRIGVSGNVDWDRTDNGTEVLILDEDDFGTDFNQDGDQIDNNLRTEQQVDRSRDVSELGAKLAWDFAKDWSATVEGVIEIENYLSDEPFDPSHRGRVDRGWEVEFGLDWEFRHGWKVKALGGVSREQSNRSAAAGASDEEVDYRDWFVGLSISARI